MNKISVEILAKITSGKQRSLLSIYYRALKRISWFVPLSLVYTMYIQGSEVPCYYICILYIYNNIPYHKFKNSWQQHAIHAKCWIILIRCIKKKGYQIDIQETNLLVQKYFSRVSTLPIFSLLLFLSKVHKWGENLRLWYRLQNFSVQYFVPYVY